MVTTIPALLAQLAATPAVAGLVRYGSRPAAAAGAGGDFDLFVLLDSRPPELESIHFYVGEVPVDLNLRTWQNLERDTPLTPIDHAICGGEVLYDRDGGLAARLQALRARGAPPASPPSPPSALVVAFVRFGHRHALDKVRGRLDTDPVLCRLVLESNLYWLVENYFRVRCLPFPGEKGALRYLERTEPALWREILRFYAATDLHERARIAEALGEHVLAPVGGLWKPGEVLTFGGEATDRLQEMGRRYLRGLLGLLGDPAVDAPCAHDET